MRYLKSVFLAATFAAFGALAKPPAEIRLAPGVFKMVPINSVGKPNPHCSVYRELVLDEAEMTRSFALMSNRLQGFCEISVLPDETYYKLQYKSTSCGSHTYMGQRITAEGVETITVTDDRTRLCHDLPAGLVELSLEKPDGQIIKLVSEL
jgi:hypothetical protein